MINNRTTLSGKDDLNERTKIKTKET